MDRSRIAIVIPAHNERETIERMVRAASAFGRPIVVDDASTDGTGAAAEAAGAIVVRMETNGGYDRALDAGFREAARYEAEVVVTMDGDGQHDPSSIQAMLEGLADGADMVVGIRPRKARMSERLFGALTRLRYGVHDPLCGLKAYRMEIYRSLGYFDRRGSVGTELMLHGLRRGYRVRQIAIPVNDRLGRSRFGQSLRGNVKILRAILNMMWVWRT